MRYAFLLTPMLVLALAVFAFADLDEATAAAPFATEVTEAAEAVEAAHEEHAATSPATATAPAEHEMHDAQGEAGHAEHADAEHPFMIERAIAVMLPTEGNEVSGILHFEQLDANRVHVSAEIDGLSPNAQHGFHIHQFGDVSSPDGKGCGGHYNPADHDHALPSSELPRHVGDLGNLTADANGHASFGMIVDGLSIAGNIHPILGRGVIIHAKADDGGQPTGNAGSRLAQGVIGVAK